MLDFIIRKFEDKPKYCRAPIYFGGERQIHIMQPFDKEKDEAGSRPRNLKHWVKLLDENGQVVFSLEAVEDFIQALRDFAQELKKEEKSDGGGELDR